MCDSFLGGQFGKLGVMPFCRPLAFVADLLDLGFRQVLDADPAALETILTGGDDFEVLATIPPKKLASFQAAAKRARVPVTAIGRVTAGQGARFVGSDGRELTFARASFTHF